MNFLLLFLIALLILFTLFQLVESQKGIFRRLGAMGKPPDLSGRAFALWEQAGHPQGRDQEFWDQAVSELTAENKVLNARSVH